MRCVVVYIGLAGSAGIAEELPVIDDAVYLGVHGKWSHGLGVVAAVRVSVCVCVSLKGMCGRGGPQLDATQATAGDLIGSCLRPCILQLLLLLQWGTPRGGLQGASCTIFVNVV